MKKDIVIIPILIVSSVLLYICLATSQGLFEEGGSQLRTQGGALNMTPIIIVYTGVNDDYGEMLASLIREEDVSGADVFVTADPELVSLGASLPNTVCIVVHADNAAEMTGLEESLSTYFIKGGGVIGMKDACYLSSSGDLATRVFPTYANFSVKETHPDKWARTYLRNEVKTINSDLPESFTVMSMGTYFSADIEGEYLEVPGEWSVLYRDSETSSPQVLAYETEGGGRSVAFPGIWVVSTSRLPVYYGNLVKNEDFAELFTNSVRWAGESSRYTRLSGEWSNRLEKVTESREKLVEEAEERMNTRSSRRTYTLLGLWTLGLVTSTLITWKLIIHPGQI